MKIRYLFSLVAAGLMVLRWERYRRLTERQRSHADQRQAEFDWESEGGALHPAAPDDKASPH